MSKGKIIALVALLTFSLGMSAIGNAVAGVKVKCSNVKWEEIEVGDEKGHSVADLCAQGGTQQNRWKNVFLWGVWASGYKAHKGSSQAHRSL